ncbi:MULTISPECIES: Mov34/MPN/PAD-1 family protein [Thalassospira]|uniref:Peptidase M67 family protein n=2 Tax=Thalassospira TaxID=168934 RepID=A0AB72UCM6_9PROT|nr:MULTISPECIES: M67 family metallopeptidase [Thalassospira]AJD51847.1 peptidase M67 family protein [Thalassospira xiamenensis M-5 = DSM 17429]KEO58183.1 hypothetical protein SMB34_15025 [Thalassospira permensis NBRC 106175]SIS99411.1 Proteasome lid subunit RPN8/RPN11, contains Jab1/MPN metalloenzyme (JAMM) motif [Thalassospira xiamenensis M-5 = DSM 17429]
MIDAGKIIKLRTGLLAEISDIAAAAWPEECCGLLIADAESPEVILRFVAARNAAIDRQKTFEIDPHVLIATHRSVRQRGEAIIGCYHSHPNGDCQPSKTDLSRAEEAGFLWLIFATGKNGVDEWKLYRRMPERADDTAPRYFKTCEIVEP